MPYSKETATLLPAGLTDPINVALVSVKFAVAMLDRPGEGGTAIKARLCADENPDVALQRTSPGTSPALLTKTGVVCEVEFPLPNCPEDPNPHAAVVPSEQRARQCEAPAEIETIVLPASTPLETTFTGAELELLLPLPN